MATQPYAARIPVEWLLVRVAILGRIFGHFSETTECDSVLHSAFSIAPSFSDFVFADIDSLVECSLSSDAETDTSSVDSFQLIRWVTLARADCNSCVVNIDTGTTR